MTPPTIFTTITPLCKNSRESSTSGNSTGSEGNPKNAHCLLTQTPITAVHQMRAPVNKPGSLELHERNCTFGENSRRKYKWCPEVFASFASVRQHKRRKHPAEYNHNLEQELSAPKVKIFRKLSEIEPSCVKGAPFLKKRAKVVNLTEHQVRHERDNPKYAKCLQ